MSSNPRNDVLSTNVKYKPFKTFVSLSWDGKPRIVHKFTHSLTQYTPSSYAEITMVYPKKDINTFLAIEQTPIVSRAVSVSCITQGFGANTIYDNDASSKIFGGPWKLICVDYSMNPAPASMITDEIDTTPTESYIIVLKCVDRVWYSMTLEEKFGTFSPKTYKNISDCVRYILNTHRAKGMEVDDNNVSFPWSQSKMTDYQFIRSILAYCNPPGFHFFCNNEIGYFKPIGTAGCIPGEIEINLQGRSVSNLVSTVNKQYLEKISDGPMVVPFGEGFDDDTHETQQANPLGGSGKSGGGMRYINFAIDNPAIKKAFAANINFRTRMFGRVVKLKTFLMTDYNPLYTVKLKNNAPEKYPTLASGEYYVVSLKNEIYYQANWSEIPCCWMVLARGGD